MWLFKKKKVIDLTEKDKIPESVKERIRQKYKETGSDYKDLTSSDSGGESALGFLGSLASSSAASSSLNEDSDEYGKQMSLRHLKVKIEDIEYKINSLRGRIDKILDRLDLAEKKIDKFGR